MMERKSSAVQVRAEDEDSDQEVDNKCFGRCCAGRDL